jgi:hypothetical protein
MMGRGSEAIDKKADKNTGTIEARRNYPAVPLSYTVKVSAEARKIIITADLDSPLPEDQVGKACFQIELFPPILFGKSWNMDGQTGIFPTDSYGTLSGNEVVPYATGKILTIAPETSSQRMIIKAIKGELFLVDGRTHGKAGWFHVRTLIPAGETRGVIEWEIEAIPIENFTYPPVIQISQVGYLPAEPKKAVIELDKSVKEPGTVTVKRINPDGTRTNVFAAPAAFWGKFLRFHYAVCDFSSLKEPGLYEMYYDNAVSNIFRISEDIYDQYVWQPSLEYYLPVQMCHMRVE